MYNANIYTTVNEIYLGRKRVIQFSFKNSKDFKDFD